MKEVLNEIMDFISSYSKSDQMKRTRELFRQKGDLLEQGERLILLEYLAKKRNVKMFLAFCEDVKVFMSLMQLEEFATIILERDSKELLFDIEHDRIKEFVIKTSEMLETKDKELYLSFIFELAIKYDYISVIQELLSQDRYMHFIKGDYEDYRELLQEQSDKRIDQNVKSYFSDGTICEEWQKFLVDYQYIPDVCVDYFATRGLEICKENLKSYKKPRLLSDKTTLEELNDFIDNQYNWDDGVEIPYFIMYHKNCDLALRKKLFELGAGDCIDENTYKDVDKDPWKRFILELDEMIKKEENK